MSMLPQLPVLLKASGAMQMYHMLLRRICVTVCEQCVWVCQPHCRAKQIKAVQHRHFLGRYRPIPVGMLCPRVTCVHVRLKVDRSKLL
jgi:hypothetical protein